MSHSIRQNYILSIIKTIAGLLFPLVTFMYASRVLSVDGIGKIDYVTHVVSIFIIFATLGITTYGTREGAKVRNNKYLISKIVKELLVINLVTTIITYFVFYFCISYVEKFYIYKELFLVYGICIGFTALGLEWLYNALEEFRYITVRTLVFQILSIILMLLFVKDSGDSLVYMGILAFSSVGSYILNFVHARRFIDFNYKSKLQIGKHLLPIFVLFSNTIIGNIYLTLDTIMLGWMTSSYYVGLYAASNKLNRISLSIITALFVVVLPRIAYYREKKDLDSIKILIEKSINLVFFLSLPMACLIFMFSSDILIILSGKDFLPATTCTKILSLIIILIPISTMASNELLIPFGKENKLLISSIAGCCINIILNYLMIPELKETGAAIASLVSEFSVSLVSLYFALKCVNFSKSFLLLWQYVLSSIIMCILIYPIMIMWDGIERCFIMPFIGLIIYLGVLYFFNNSMLLFFVNSIREYRKKNI